MNSQHPTYPNPTIQEALCEIRFRLPEGVAWGSTLFGDFFKQIQADFPSLEPVMTVGVQFLVGPHGELAQGMLPPRQMMRHKHAERNLLLQLSEDLLTINVLPKYSGWSSMMADVIYAWTRARDVVNPAYITRIGLRYINVVPRTTPDQRPADWFKPSEYIPGVALASLPGFLYRLETRLGPSNRLIVTMGEPPDQAEPDARGIVLDIDCISEQQINVDEEAIVNEIGKLHEMAWNVFEATTGPRLETVLQGGVP